MNACQQELHETIAAVMKAHPRKDPEGIAIETVRRLAGKPGWSVTEQPSRRQLWQGELRYTGTSFFMAWQRYTLRQAVEHVRDTRVSEAARKR
jgi:hypothetical protein